MRWFMAAMLVVTCMLQSRCVTAPGDKQQEQNGGPSKLAYIEVSELGVTGYSYGILRLISTSEAMRSMKPQTLAKGANQVNLQVAPGTYRIMLEYYTGQKKLLYSAEYCQGEVKNNEMTFVAGGNPTKTIHVCAKGSEEPSAADTPQVADVTIHPVLMLSPHDAPTMNDATRSLGFDNIYGKSVARSSSYYSDNGRIYFGGQELVLYGINWFGFDTTNQIVHGLWTGRTMDSFLTQIQQLGFNALRLPIAPETLLPATKTRGEIHTMKLKASALANLADLITLARQKQMYVLLDLHTCSMHAEGPTGRPDAEACPGYTKDSWLETLRKMALFSKNHSNIIGIDLYNEPYNLSWHDWRKYVQQGGKQILTINPQLLVVVEGVGEKDAKPAVKALGSDNNFALAREEPLDLPAARLVYSPHAFGSDEGEHKSLSAAADFPANMPTIWDDHFGYLAGSGATLVVGQFGGKYQSEKDKKWQDAFVDYMINKRLQSFFYSSFDPNSGEMGGLLLEDWQNVNPLKQALVRRLMH